MNKEEIIGVLTTILQDLLVNPEIELNADTVRDDVPGWDSFAYVNFIVAVETQFQIRFRVADVESFQTVGDIASEILELKA